MNNLGKVPLLFVLLGMFRTGETDMARCTGNEYNSNWSPSASLASNTKCVNYVDKSKSYFSGLNGNGVWDSCIFYKESKRRTGARDPQTKHFDLLDVLDVGSKGRDAEPAGSFVYNDNFPKAFTPKRDPPHNNYKPPTSTYGKGSTLTGGIIRPRLPDVGAPNPYFVEVSGITLKKELLHNWLHFRVFMNYSVADDQSNLHSTKERSHHATGKIAAMLMMIKDQEGYPIGDFSQELPCSESCGKYPHDVYYGDRRNAYPCSYTPPRATSHPGMFVFDADPGFYTKPDPIYVAAGKFGNIDPERRSDKVRVKEGVREVHATWSYNQDTCNFVTEIHIYTMIFEEMYYPDSMQCASISAGATAHTTFWNCKYYAWPAIYNILYTKGKDSLGAADYVNVDYWKERYRRNNDEIDCHVPLFDAPKTAKDAPYIKGSIPFNTLDASGKVTNVVKVPHKYHHMMKLDYDTFQPSSGSPWEYWTVEYLGQYIIDPVCRTPNLLNDFPEAQKYINTLKALPSVNKFINDNKGVQCPCPALPSPQPLEERTADPNRLHGRLIHASHMALAYMFLAPLACFVARYYKETFITVFCFQEYWWFMWHVVLLIIACVFVMGAILALYRGERQEIAVSTNLLLHKILGYCSIVVFYIEIFSGFFRHADPVRRMRQIFLHWLIGNFNIFCAVGSMFAMAFVKQSGMTCGVVYTILVWTLFVIVWFVLMDIHMKKTDKALDLRPPRSYLPPPVVRLFNHDAPGRDFRMMMLAVYLVNLGIIQYLVSYYIWTSDNDDENGHKEQSCYFYWKARWGATATLSADDLDAGDDYNYYGDPN